MVLITRKMSVPMADQITKTSTILSRLLLTIACIIAPVLIIIIDPIHSIVNYNLRLETGSALYNLLRNDLKGARLSIYPFNISNADKFMSGEDSKLKVNEVGPFVYQEYRWYEDMEMNEDGTEMGMTPKFRPEFVPEDSIAYPKDINLTVPNIPMLSATALLSPYPSFLRFMFSTMAAQTKSKAIMNIDMHSYLWGYKNPIITMMNTLAPGLVYFDSLGLLDRLYDKESDYRIVVGATKQDRFKIKSVTKYRHLQQGGINDVDVSCPLEIAPCSNPARFVHIVGEVLFHCPWSNREVLLVDPRVLTVRNQQTFVDTYEGIGYPPELTPDVPINWYRIPICRNFGLEYKGSKTMEYGGEGLLYAISNRTFINEQDPVTKKTYPDGLMDISKCYYGMPFVGSNSHFLDGDPKLLEYVDGLLPDKTKHSNIIIIDRRAAIPFYTKLSLQLSLVVDDISYNIETRRFSNTILPVLRIEVNQPRMSDGIMAIFYIVYTVGPLFLIILESVLIILSLYLIISTARSMYRNWSINSRWLIFETAKEKKILTETQSDVPLVFDYIKA